MAKKQDRHGEDTPMTAGMIRDLFRKLDGPWLDSAVRKGLEKIFEVLPPTPICQKFKCSTPTHWWKAGDKVHDEKCGDCVKCGHDFVTHETNKMIPLSNSRPFWATDEN